MARIITFYSYKGGTGRSMALANVAWIMASNGKRVLVVDWDLEAPGLHRYLAPFISDEELTGYESQGVIDFFTDFAVKAATPPREGERLPNNWFERYADISKWGKKLHWPSGEDLNLGDRQTGGIDFVPAGRQGPEYANRVDGFDWVSFYERFNGGAFIDAMRVRMSKYDYVLIDSRTGVSDTSGICTVHMPDTLVVCFTLNHQSIRGSAAVAESVRQQRPDIRILPLATRVDPSESSLLLPRMKKRAESAFTTFLSLGVDAEKYWFEMEVQYFARYAYAERLAPFEEKAGISSSALPAMERITRYITDNEVSGLRPLPEEHRAQALAKFEGDVPRPVKAVEKIPASSWISRLDYWLRLRNVHLALQILLACLITGLLAATLGRHFSEDIVTVTLPSIRVGKLFSIELIDTERQPAARVTSVVRLSSGMPNNGQWSPCARRVYLGAVLKALAQIHPAVVVMDMYFPAEFCADTSDNQALAVGIQALCAQNIPVVVGRVLETKDSRTETVRLRPTVDFKALGCTCVKEGIDWVNGDVRRLKLWWPEVESTAGNKKPFPSLALVAALAFEPKLLDDSPLKGRTASAAAPYAKFLRAEAFRSVTADQFVCGLGPGTSARACGAGELRPTTLLNAGKIVVIGEDHPDTEFPTSEGDLEGYLLQANYIEALVDLRLIIPCSRAVTWAAGFVLFAVVEYLFWLQTPARVLSMTGVLGMAGLMCLGIAALGYYLDPLPIAVSAFVISRFVGALAALLPARSWKVQRRMIS